LRLRARPADHGCDQPVVEHPGDSQLARRLAPRRGPLILSQSIEIHDAIQFASSARPCALRGYRSGVDVAELIEQGAGRCPGRAMPLGDISFEPLWTEGFYINLG
jgi:hypothetical protein